MSKRITPAEAGSRARGIADARLVTRAMVKAVRKECDSGALQDAWREADTKLYLMEIEALRSPDEPPEAPLTSDQKRRMALGGRPNATKPTIPLRIRVGVTADGTWLAMGSNTPDMASDADRDAAFVEILRDENAGPTVAWHWITAEVPMPEVEQGEVAGEVERG